MARADVLYMLDGVRIETGVDLSKLVAAGEFICTALGQQTRSRAGRAVIAKNAAA